MTRGLVVNVKRADDFPEWVTSSKEFFEHDIVGSSRVRQQVQTKLAEQIGLKKKKKNINNNNNYYFEGFITCILQAR